jgi:hypothetical protein
MASKVLPKWQKDIMMQVMSNKGLNTSEFQWIEASSGIPTRPFQSLSILQRATISHSIFSMTCITTNGTLALIRKQTPDTQVHGNISSNISLSG